MNELQSVSQPPLCSSYPIWKKSKSPFLNGQGPPFISQGDTTCTPLFPNWTFLLFMDGDWYGCCPNDTLMGQPTPTSTSAGSRRNVGTWLSADDMTSVRPVTNRSFLSTACQLSNMHVCPSSHNILPVMVRMKPGIYLTGTNVLTPGVPTPAPARDECLEALIIPTGRGEACVRSPVAT